MHLLSLITMFGNCQMSFVHIVLVLTNYNGYLFSFIRLKISAGKKEDLDMS